MRSIGYLLILVWVCVPRSFADDAPAAWYRFDEREGTALHDRAGHFANGSIAGPVWDEVEGIPGLRFAEGQYVDLGKDLPPLLSGDRTIAAWVHLDASPHPDEYTNWTILENEQYRKSGSILRIDGATSKLTYRVNQEGTEQYGMSAVSLENRQTSFVAVTCKNGQVTLYVNGRPDGLFAAQPPAVGDASLRIGSLSQSFAGVIFDVTIYEHALDGSAMAALYWRDAPRFRHDSDKDRLGVTPHVYRSEREAYVDVDFLGVAPLFPGESVTLGLFAHDGAPVDIRAIPALPETLKAGYTFPLPSPGEYEVRARLDSPSRAHQTTVSVVFSDTPDTPPSPKEHTAGPLPIPPAPPAFTIAAAPGGALLLEVDEKTIPVESSFSIPGGDWHRWRSGEPKDDTWPVSASAKPNEVIVESADASYRISRHAQFEGDRVLVRDTITNLTNEALGIQITHRLDTKAFGQARVSLSGRETSRPTAARAINRCPVLCAGVPGAGIGLVPVDDVFLVQSRGEFDAERQLTLSTNEFALDAGASYTLEWALYVNASGDYYDAVNAIRRHEGRNSVRIDGSMAFLQGTQQQRDVSLVPDAPYFELRNAAIAVVACLSWCADDPSISLEGIEFTAYPEERRRIRAMMDRLQGVAPKVKGMFHIAPQLYATNRPEQYFPDSRVTDPAGKQVVYGYNYENGSYFSRERYEANWRWWIYYPTLENSFGKVLLDSVDVMMDEMGCRGVFADGFFWGYGGEYTYDRWDGHSADIDPATHRLARKKGSVLLLSQEAMLQWCKKIWGKGGVVVANGVVPARTICAQPLIFDKEVTEGPDVALLPTPVTLGDPSLCRDEASVYRDVLNKLRWGNLYFYYNDPKELAHESLPKRMYPITVQQVEPGCVRGPERIVTMRSDVYGWPGSKDLHRVYRYDSRGRRVDPDALTTADADSVRTQIVLGTSESAVIERIPIAISSDNPVNVRVEDSGDGCESIVLNGEGAVRFPSLSDEPLITLNGPGELTFTYADKKNNEQGG